MSIVNVSVGRTDVKSVNISDGNSLAIIAGPCAIESMDHALFMAEKLLKITNKLGLSLIYKSCYDKDCRSSPDSYHGCGIDEGLRILESVRKGLGIPVVTDVSSEQDMSATANVVDMIQIPAYLCRQTHLLRSAGKTLLPIHVKKGQFMSPNNMRNSVSKILREGNDQIILGERGTFFGYGDLVNDFRSLDVMRSLGFPVCYDATHSIQRPTSTGSISQGDRKFIPTLVRAAAASGINALFLEVHDNPDNALSDPATQLPLDFFENILIQAKTFHEAHAEMLEIRNDSQGLS